MAKQSNKDPNLFAKNVFESLLDKLDPEAAAECQPTLETKNPKKQEAGRKGGLKGGRARAKRLSAVQRRDIAKKATKIRWEPDRKD
jgi:hypothetical protein